MLTIISSSTQIDFLRINKTDAVIRTPIKTAPQKLVLKLHLGFFRFPSSVYAAYNVINAPKMIVNKPLMGHSCDKEFYEYLNRWIEGQLGLAKPIAPVAKSSLLSVDIDSDQRRI